VGSSGALLVLGALVMSLLIGADGGFTVWMYCCSLVCIVLWLFRALPVEKPVENFWSLSGAGFW
jgi:hypothetical protein